MDIMTCCLGSLFTVYYIYAMHFFFCQYLFTYFHLCILCLFNVYCWNFHLGSIKCYLLLSYLVL